MGQSWEVVTNYFFEHSKSQVHTEKHKPDPESYLIALKRFGFHSSETIAFEDSESGFKAATAAGLKVFGIKHEYNERHDFSLCQDALESFDQCLDMEFYDSQN